MIYKINPVAKPRMVNSDRWRKRKCVVKYWAFKDHCTLLGMTLPLKGAQITFHIQMPKSWSKKKKEFYNGQPHMQRPDVDNLGKALMDSCMKEDCTVWQISLEKRWAYEGSIEIITNVN